MVARLGIMSLSWLGSRARQYVRKGCLLPNSSSPITVECR
jgi:hypothetical protein